MLSSAALIHVVAASYASSGFTCGLDPTLSPTRESREMISTSSNMIFATLRESLRPDAPRTLHSVRPFASRPAWAGLILAQFAAVLGVCTPGCEPWTSAFAERGRHRPEPARWRCRHAGGGRREIGRAHV